MSEVLHTTLSVVISINNTNSSSLAVVIAICNVALLGTSLNYRREALPP
jgi:hypothetical protein